MSAIRMKPIRLVPAAAAAVLFGLTVTSPTIAQEKKEVVAVDVTGVKAHLATDLGVDVSKIPATVHVPAAIAAKVCGVKEADLTPKSGTKVPCLATSVTKQLTQIVKREIKGK